MSCQIITGIFGERCATCGGDNFGGRFSCARPGAPDPEIAGRTIDEWRELAQRDDCLEVMAPADLRALVNALAGAFMGARDHG